MAEETSEKLRLTVKTTKEKIEVEVPADANAKQVPLHSVRGPLIFSDSAVLATYSLSPSSSAEGTPVRKER